MRITKTTKHTLTMTEEDIQEACADWINRNNTGAKALWHKVNLVYTVDDQVEASYTWERTDEV